MKDTKPNFLIKTIQSNIANILKILIYQISFQFLRHFNSFHISRFSAILNQVIRVTVLKTYIPSWALFYSLANFFNLTYIVVNAKLGILSLKNMSVWYTKLEIYRYE